MTGAVEKVEGGSRGIHRRMYDWVLHWAGHRHAVPALFLIALAEASFFPIPPDVLLMAMAMARPRRALVYSLVSTAGSVIGGVLGYLIGWGLWSSIEGWAYANLGFMKFNPETFAKVQEAYQSNAFLALFTAGFTPIPYKIFTIAAGIFGVNLLVFVVASVLGRAGRFLLVGGLIAFFGPRIQPFIEKYLGWLTLAFVALLILGFVVIGMVH